MKYFGNGLSEKHKDLNKIIRKADRLEEAKERFLELHAAVHCGAPEVDEIFADLQPYEYHIIPASKDDTIAWAVWHLARIEDMTMNILIADSKQLFDKQRQKKLNTKFTDTGVMWLHDSIIKLSKEINAAELLRYRSDVGKRTREIISGLTADDMLRKVTQEGIDRIRSEGGTCENSEPLLDYWGKKDVAGLLLMPPTRHAIMHLNECCKYKQHIRAGKKLYRT